MNEPIQYAGTVEDALDPRAHDFLTGHDDASEQLKAAFANQRIPQAWLLQGLEGVGKASFAWHFSRRLVEFGHIDTPISDEQMERFARGSQSYIYDISLPFDDKGSLKSQIPIDSIRNLNSKLSLKAEDNHWRVVIIDPAEALNPSAANALLKLLEEPPARVVFFLISHNPHRLLPTILSRCQTLRFHPLSVQEMKTIWPQVTKMPMPDEARFTLSEGSMRMALTMQDDQNAIYDDMLLLIKEDMPRAQMIITTKALIGKLSRVEAMERAQTLFSLLFGRLARIALQIETGRENEIAAAIKVKTHLNQWATLSSKISQNLIDAQRLNLDPETTILNCWLEIDQQLKSS